MLIYGRLFNISLNHLINFRIVSKKITSQLYNRKKLVDISGYVGERTLVVCGHYFRDMKIALGTLRWLYVQISSLIPCILNCLQAQLTTDHMIFCLICMLLLFHALRTSSVFHAVLLFETLMGYYSGATLSLSNCHNQYQSPPGHDC